MILINPKLDRKIEKVIADKDGRYIIADILLNQVLILLVIIYAPNDQTQQVLFFKRLQQHLEPFADEHIVVGGDFNGALTDKDKKGGHPVCKKAPVIKEINQLFVIKTNGMRKRRFDRSTVIIKQSEDKNFHKY